MSGLEVDFETGPRGGRLRARFIAPLSGAIGVFGPSGAGKSTLLSALAGFTPVARGRIALDGAPLEETATRVRLPPHARDVALCFQEPRLFAHLSVRGNLKFAVKRARRAGLTLEAAAAAFEIEELLERRPARLSGGEKSRVALARAALTGAKLLLLDEPFAALDRARRRRLLGRLRDVRAAAGLPFMLVSHGIDDLAAVCDTLVTVEHGEVTACGAFAETVLSAPARRLIDPDDIGAQVPAGALALAAQGAALNAWLPANHVMVATGPPVGLSARNIRPCVIREVIREKAGGRLLLLTSDAATLVARVTEDARRDLGLEVGRRVWAVAKAHAG